MLSRAAKGDCNLHKASWSLDVLNEDPTAACIYNYPMQKKYQLHIKATLREFPVSGAHQKPVSMIYTPTSNKPTSNPAHK